MNAALDRLHELEAEHLWVSYHDYSGVARTKSVPPARFEEVVERGVTFAMANWDLIVTGQQVPDPGFALDSGDFHVIPDERSIVTIPHRPGVAQAFGCLVDGEGRPWSGDPRARLLDQVDALTALGLRAEVAFEAEFSLITSVGGGYELADRGRMFTTDELDARWSLIERWLDTMDSMGIAVHQVAKEWGPAQYEISLLPADPLTAVERFLLARQVIRAISRDSGIHATFMPKPFIDVPGNGLHVHIGLIADDGANALAVPAPDELSATGRAAVAGLLAHAPAQSAIGSASVNSYKRLLPNSAAPAHVCWGFGNRAALVRIPGPGPARRLEYRAADATANAYLLLTGLLAAIADGVRRDAPVPAPVTIDVGRLGDAEAAAMGVERLPSDLGAALDAFEADGTLTAAMGEVIAQHYPPVKRQEVKLYRDATNLAPEAREVSDWERDIYLEHT